jgi:protocatechuate 3,4-dioxygenase alpha subunit
MTLPPTPGQTIGPFFGFALPYAGGPDLVPPASPNAIRIHGRVLDGAREPVPDALIEISQLDEHGRASRESGLLHRDGWAFTGWGRAATDRAGIYSFSTVRPATSDGSAPFIAVTVFARGLLDRLFTRLYLPEDTSALDSDPLLGALSPEQRATLVAVADPTGYRFDIVLQGEDETVFLEHANAASHR